jgi:hypothetical protein
MSEYVGLIVTKKYEYQINFTSEQRFYDFISDSRDVQWGRLFDRNSGDIIASWGTNS